MALSSDCRGGTVTALAWRLLRLSWWAVLPGFLLAVLGFIRDRACFDRYHLLPGIDTQPTLALVLATAYVLGHCWLIALYGYVVVQTGELVPGHRSALRAVGNAWPQVAIMMTVFVLEYVPAALWSGLARVTGVCAP